MCEVVGDFHWRGTLLFNCYGVNYTFCLQCAVAYGLFPYVLASVNADIQRGEKSLPYALSVRCHGGIRYVVVGYFHEEQFRKVVITAGFASGDCEELILDNLINWFCSTQSVVQFPVAIASDGTSGVVGKYVTDCASAEGRPILEMDLLDLAWLVDTLRRCFSSVGSESNPWGFLENLRVRGSGVYRCGLFHSLPSLGKVIIYFYCTICLVVFFLFVVCLLHFDFVE